MKVSKAEGNLKRRILLSAKQLFLKHGYAKTTMRKIAKQINVSATAIYLHYENKASIMHALHQEGFRELTNQFKPLQHVEHPFERLKAMGKVYINFALENPDFYEIMFIMKEPLEHLENPNMEPSEWQEGEAAYQALYSVIEDCQKQGFFKGYDLNNLALLIWANMHGLCALKNNGHLAFINDKINEETDVSVVMRQSFDLYTKMIEHI